jgi:hypothetical protein
MRRGGAMGRLLELPWRQRCTQFETPRLVLLRDGDGGKECLFPPMYGGGAVLEQNVAMHTIDFRISEMSATKLGDRGRDGGERGIDLTACASTRPGSSHTSPMRNRCSRQDAIA